MMVEFEDSTIPSWTWIASGGSVCKDGNHDFSNISILIKLA
jgi:hypothetical protein